MNANTEYTAFHNALEGGPHGVLHAAIAGDMGQLTSPNGEMSACHFLCRSSSIFASSYSSSFPFSCCKM